MLIRDRIAELITSALDEAQQQGLLPCVPVEGPIVEPSKDFRHGDFASSVPLRLARPMQMNPVDIAVKLAQLIKTDEEVGKIWAEPPGFINFTLSQDWLVRQVDVIRKTGALFGNVSIGLGGKVQIDFVSINPTGPLHVGHARGAMIGSALANVMEAAGYDVVREYYLNDAGNQIDRFNESLYVRYLQTFDQSVDLPPDGYHGEYILELAEEIKIEEGDRFLSMVKTDGIRELGKIGLRKTVDLIRSDLEMVNVWFDVWFSERSLYTGGQYDKVMRILEEGGHVVDKDGARWFTSIELGDDGDCVLVRSTGVPTYFASDVAYHYEKFVDRSFDLVIDVWGADHQGHVPRLKAAVTEIGISTDRLHILISQLVTLKRRDEIVRLSKRSGDVVTLRDLVDEVGTDACRFFFLSRSPESQMEFDLELALEQSNENPVYYIQYAHARMSGILKLAKTREIDYDAGDVKLLTHDAELTLIRKMNMLPELVDMMARSLQPHHLPHYATELATAFHWFYQKCRVVSSASGGDELTKARLKLVEATCIVLGRCLGLMGMNAPQEM